MSTSVRIDLNSTNEFLTSRHLEANGAAQRFFTSEVKRLSDAYVPMDSGVLKSNVTMTANSITYNSPYARRQFYENKGNGLRGKNWIGRMWIDRKGDIVQAVEAFINRRAL